MLAEWRVDRLHMRMMRETLGLRLDLPGPFALIVVDDGDARPAHFAADADGLELFGNLLRLMVGRRGLTVGPEQPGMHLLLRRMVLPPAEIGHHLGAMRERLPGPKPRHAGEGVGIVLCPVHRPRLLLHHPPAAAAHGPIDIVLQTLRIGLALCACTAP